MMARQLEKFEEKKPGYQQLEYVVRDLGKINIYIKGLNDRKNLENIVERDGFWWLNSLVHRFAPIHTARCDMMSDLFWPCDAVSNRVS